MQSARRTIKNLPELDAYNGAIPLSELCDIAHALIRTHGPRALLVAKANREDEVNFYLEYDPRPTTKEGIEHGSDPEAIHTHDL